MKQFQVTVPDHVVVVMDWLRECTSPEGLASNNPPTEGEMWPIICITPEVRETRLEVLPQHSALPDMQGRIVIEQSMVLIHSDHSTEQQSAFIYFFLPTSTQVQLTVTWTDFRLEGYAWKLFAGIAQHWPQTNSDYRDWQRTSAGRKAEAAGIWRNWWLTQAAPELRQKSLAMAQVRASEERWKQLGPYRQLMYSQKLNAWRDLLQKAYKVIPDHKTKPLDQVYEWLAEFELHGITQEQKDALLAYLEQQLQVALQQEDSVYEYRIETLQMRLALLTSTLTTVLKIDLDSLASVYEERILDIEIEDNLVSQITASLPEKPAYAFECRGDGWEITYETQSCHISDLIGLRYLAYLLSHPHREFLAVDLSAYIHHSNALSLSSEYRDEEFLEVSDGTDRYEILDDAARSQYRQRLYELREERAEADAAGNKDRLQEINKETFFIEQELTKNQSRGKKSRVFADPNEKARSTITKNITKAISKIAEYLPQCANYLKGHIETGNRFCYRPSIDIIIEWHVKLSSQQ